MKQNNQRPRVEVGLNETAVLKLLRDKAHIGESAHGPYYMYSVSHDGEEKVLFATAEVHQQILESGLKSGDAFSIKKIAVQNGKKLNTNIEFAVVTRAEVKSNGKTNGVASVEDDGLKDVMAKCLQDAVSITQSVNTMPWRGGRC